MITKTHRGASMRSLWNPGLVIVLSVEWGGKWSLWELGVIHMQKIHIKLILKAGWMTTIGSSYLGSFGRPRPCLCEHLTLVAVVLKHQIPGPGPYVLAKQGLVVGGDISVKSVLLRHSNCRHRKHSWQLLFMQQFVFIWNCPQVCIYRMWSSSFNLAHG